MLSAIMVGATVLGMVDSTIQKIKEKKRQEHNAPLEKAATALEQRASAMTASSSGSIANIANEASSITMNNKAASLRSQMK